MGRPGAISRAHHGVLFLDEAPEFSTRVLDTLRQPLESGEVVIHRAATAVRYPARFQLVLASNPCPCGNATGKGLECTCSSLTRRRYQARLSGPLLDRVDITVGFQPLSRAQLNAQAGESSSVVRQRVIAARQRQSLRYSQTPWSTNAQASGQWLSKNHALSPQAATLLERSLERGQLTLRGADRVLRLAWTLADLAQLDRPGLEELGQALMLRSGGFQ